MLLQKIVLYSVKIIKLIKVMFIMEQKALVLLELEVQTILEWIM